MLENFKTIKLKLDYKNGLVSSPFAQVKVGEDRALLEVQLTDGENVLDMSGVKLTLQYHNLESDAADEVPFTALPGKTGWFRVEIPDHATSKAGFIRCAIVVNDGERRIHTGNFDVYCQGSPVEPLAVYESDNFKTFLKALGVADGFAEKADKLLNDQVASFDNTIKEKTSELDSAITAKFDELKSTIQEKISEVDGIVQSKVDYVDTKTQEAITSAKSKVDAAAEQWNSSLTQKQTEFDNALSAEKQIWQSERSKQSQEFNSNIQNAKDALASINESKATKEREYDDALAADRESQRQALNEAVSAANASKNSLEQETQAAKEAISDAKSQLSSSVSDFDTKTKAKLDEFDATRTSKVAEIDALLNSKKLEWSSALDEQKEQITQKTDAAIEESKQSYNEEKNRISKDGRAAIDRLNAAAASFEGATPLTPEMADSRYQPKGDYATKSDLETLADSEALSSLATKEELKSYIKDETSSVKTTNLADGSVTADKLSETYLKPSEANNKYASKSTATTSNNGLMSYSDKSKLNGIEAGAQKNAVTSVNGKTGAVTINPPSQATTSTSGLMSASDKAKLDSIQSGAQKNAVTSVNGRTGAVTIEEPSLATSSTKGLMSASDKSKLDGIQAGAQKNTINKIEGKSGDNVTFPIATANQWGWMGSGDKAKLDKIEAGAQKNPTDYVSTSTLNSRLSQKQDKGNYIQATNGTAEPPATGTPNTYYFQIEG